MNAQAIIERAVEEEMMKHFFMSAAKKCACGDWIAPRGRQWGTMQLQHVRHVAQVVAIRLLDRGELRNAKAA